MRLSSEQIEVKGAIKSGSDVVVRACAGAGKSTTIKSCIESLEDHCLVLCYNKSLQLEMQEKLINTKNARACTFHAFAGQIYGKIIKDDNELKRAIESNTLPNIEGLREKVVFVDEAQDLKEIFVKLVKKAFFKQTILIGDEKQLINDYDIDFSANSSYILEPILHFCKPFVHLQMSTSYRLRKEHAAFVNFVSGSNIQGAGEELFKSHMPPIYIKICGHNDFEFIDFVETMAAFAKTLILSRKKKNNKKLKSFINVLKDRRNKVYVQGVDASNHNEAQIEVMSYHSSKGLEASNILLFDTNNKDVSENPFHVAATRAKGGCVFVHFTSFSKICPQIAKFAISNKNIVYASNEDFEILKKRIQVDEDEIDDSYNLIEEIKEELEAKETALIEKRVSLENYVFGGAGERWDECFQTEIIRDAAEIEFGDEDLTYKNICLKEIYCNAIKLTIELKSGRPSAEEGIFSFIRDPTGELNNIEISNDKKLKAGTLEYDLLTREGHEILNNVPKINKESSARDFMTASIFYTCFDTWRIHCTATLYNGIDEWFSNDAYSAFLRTASFALKSNFSLSFFNMKNNTFEGEQEVAYCFKEIYCIDNMFKTSFNFIVDNNSLHSEAANLLSCRSIKKHVVVNIMNGKITEIKPKCDTQAIAQHFGIVA